MTNAMKLIPDAKGPSLLAWDVDGTFKSVALVLFKPDATISVVHDDEGEEQTGYSLKHHAISLVPRTFGPYVNQARMQVFGSPKWPSFTLSGIAHKLGVVCDGAPVTITQAESVLLTSGRRIALSDLRNIPSCVIPSPGA
jgi:hypothetical protein